MDEGTKKLYRLVFSDPAAPEDFQPDTARGLAPKPPLHPESMSAWGSAGKARDLAKWLIRTGKRTWVGIAEVDVMPGSSIGWMPDGPPSQHCALWGDATELAQLARIVERWGAEIADDVRRPVQR